MIRREVEVEEKAEAVVEDLVVGVGVALRARQ